MTSRRRVVLSLVLVALVALAGCTSGPLGDSNESDGGGATTAEPTATIESMDEYSFPDGASEETVENATALAAAHTDVLAQTGYALEVTAARSTDARSTNSTYVVRRDGDSGNVYQQNTHRADGESEQVAVFANESGVYEKRGTGSPSYNVDTSTTSENYDANNILEAHETLVRLGEWTDPALVTEDGQALVEYDLDGIDADSEIVGAETVTAASGSLLVDQRGVVHRVTVDFTHETDDTTTESHYEYRLTAHGDVTVQKPDWVSDATETQGPSRPNNRINVVATAGSVEDGRVEDVNITVMRAAGSDDIDLSAATIQWIGPETAKTLVAGESATADTFVVDAVKDSDDSAPVINEAGDRLLLSVDASKVGSGLQPGEEVQLTITTEYGTKTTYWASVPENLGDESVVLL